jgi:hypothetical protein
MYEKDNQLRSLFLLTDFLEYPEVAFVDKLHRQSAFNYSNSFRGLDCSRPTRPENMSATK